MRALVYHTEREKIIGLTCGSLNKTEQDDICQAFTQTCKAYKVTHLFIRHIKATIRLCGASRSLRLDELCLRNVPLLVGFIVSCCHSVSWVSDKFQKVALRCESRELMTLSNWPIEPIEIVVSA